MSTPFSILRMTEKQKAILGALSTTREVSNAQVAAAAGVSEEYASRVLGRLARAGKAKSRYAQDAEDPQTHYRLWKRVNA